MYSHFHMCLVNVTVQTTCALFQVAPSPLNETGNDIFKQPRGVVSPEKRKRIHKRISLKKYSQFEDEGREDSDEEAKLEMDYANLKDTLETIKQMGLSQTLSDSDSDQDNKNERREEQTDNEIKAYENSQQNDNRFKKQDIDFNAKRNEKEEEASDARLRHDYSFVNKSLYDYLYLLKSSSFDSDDLVSSLKKHIFKLLANLQ